MQSIQVMLFKINQLILKIKKLDVLLCGIFIFSLFLRYLIPPNISYNTPHDDLLGVQIANSFSRGEWFGGWNNRTLAKPSGYSIYLSLIHFTKISPVLFTHILYLLTSLYFVKLLIQIFDVPKIHSKTFSRLIFLFFAFNPAVLGGAFSKIYRMSLNTIFAMIFVCVIFNIYLQLRSKRVMRNDKSSVWLCFVAGIIYAGMVLTRSEAYWILIPTLAFFLILFKIEGKNNIKSYLLVLLIGVIGYSIPIATISSLNKYVYGVYQTEDFFSGEFASTYKIWSSIQNGRDPRPSISISKIQRYAVYKVSPTAKLLEPYLETPPNTGWKTQNCNATKICDESGIWFPWELRDAAIATGQITNAVQFQAFFKNINFDIQRACKGYVFKCGPKGLAPGASSFDKLPKRQILDVSIKAVTSMFNFDSAAEGDRPYTTTDETIIREWSKIINVKNQHIIDPNNYWQGLISILELLRKIYSSLFLLIIPIFAFLTIRKKQKEEMNFYLLLGFLSVAVIIYSIGIAVTEISAGLPIGLTLYMLPAEPVFWMLGLFVITFAYKLIYEKFGKLLPE